MSSGSDSDEDYVPGEPEKVSEEESADEQTDLQYEKELDHNTKKRKSKLLAKSKKKIKTKNGTNEIVSDETEGKDDEPPKLNPEEDKKKEDDLWAKFLEGTDTILKPKVTESNNTTKPIENNQKESSNNTINKNIKEKEDDKEREKRIFEFAGETIVVENNVIKEKIKTSDNKATGKLFIYYAKLRKEYRKKLLMNLTIANSLPCLHLTV